VNNPRLVRKMLVLGTALALSLAFAGIAFAKGDSFNVDSGKTVLSPDIDTFEALSDYGVTVTAVEGAKENAHGLVFPITGGAVKAPGPTGSIEHSGGVQFTSSSGAVLVLDNFFVKLGHGKAKLFATSGTDEYRFLNLDMSSAVISGSQGADLKIKNIDATLAKPAAKALTTFVGTPIDEGTEIGTLKVKALTSAQQ
jgi:hypothetical protein